MQFICPQCGGKHFGTSLGTAEDEFGTVTDVTITEHQCHDEFKTGCKWRGKYPVTTAVESPPSKHPAH